MTGDGFPQLFTLDDVVDYIREGRRAASNSQIGIPLRYGFTWSRLPNSVAEPGPLIEHAVRLAGEDGLTLQQMRAVFSRLGKERFDRGLAFARQGGRITEQVEHRPNSTGRLQKQVVLRAA